MNDKQCNRCNQREGKNIWSEGSIAYVHGIYQMWCDRCVVEEQLVHAQKAAASIPALEAALRLLDNQPEPC
jgi:hypothetical protein